MKKLIFVIGSVLFCIPAFSQNSNASTQLTNEEAVAFIAGKTLTPALVSDGSTVNIQFNTNGVMYGNNRGSSDSGTWRVEDGKLCMSWRRWTYEGCGKLVRIDGKVRQLFPDGKAEHLIFPIN